MELNAQVFLDTIHEYVHMYVGLEGWFTYFNRTLVRVCYFVLPISIMNYLWLSVVDALLN